MRATKSLRVEKLSNEDGWSLLIKQVLPNGIDSEIQDHKEMGMQIVQKCDGLPLAIKSIGGVLCTNGNSRENWQAILRSDVWSMDGLPGDVHHAIYLSYEDLPPPLKQCFIFCSIFPQDFEFRKTDLIYGWLAEGFLPDNDDFWESGNEYYTELLQRNLLEDTDAYYYQGECKMHDILWAFARQLGKDENYQLRGGQYLSKSDSSMKIRRLSIEGNVENIEVIKKEKGLRTLIYYEPEIALDDLCKAFSKLRTINLGPYNSNLSSLPDSLCDLIQLRYLDVSNSGLAKIPNSIENLRNLEYFNCFDCRELSHVPSSIGNLRELRFLNFLNTNVKAIPTALNNLGKLSHLIGFVTYKNSLEGFSSLDGLEFLQKLIYLCLMGLERVFDRNVAERANLRSKDLLQVLYLVYTALSSEEQLSQTNEKKMTIEDVLKELCPPRSVKRIRVEGYFGRCLPNWLNLGAALPNLRDVEILNCACFKVLAMLGQLPNLHRLSIKGAYSVVRVGEEFMQGDSKSRDPTVHTMSSYVIPAFLKLNDLIFDRMPNWKEWQWNKGQPAMPKMKELFIIDCPQLRSLPEGLLLYATSLEFLQIEGADKLTTVENIPSIKDIRVLRNPNLVRISNLPSISHLGKETNLKDCLPLRCSKNGPIVRYPFRLDTHAPHCGYDTLVLSCSGENTVLSLPHSSDYNVMSIDYKNSILAITRHSWTINCSWSQIAEPNVTRSFFNHPFSVGLSWLDCSDVLTSFSEYEYLAGPIPCLSYKDHNIYVAWNYTLNDALPSTCTKTRDSLFFTGPKVPHLLDNLPTPADWFYDPSSPSEFQHMIRDFAERPIIALYWHDELINCSMCEKKWWHRCEFEIETKKSFCQESNMVLKAGVSIGALSVLLLGGFAFFCIRRQSMKKKTIRQKIEHFLRSYRVMNSTRYTYDELKKITNRFKNKIGAGAFGTVYKGELSNGIPVAVKTLHRSAWGGEQFVNEVATLGRIHHVHVVRLLGFCSEGVNQALVYEFMENGSLDKYIFSARRNRQFSMEEMLVVATGIAEGIEYLHQGCDQRILHFDIKPHNILLDHNLVPKISDFGLSKLCPKDQSYLTISAARGTMGYLAPEMYSRNFGAVSYKSDIYSFGMLILEMISGKKNIDPLRGGGVQSEEVYFPEWIYEQLAQGKDLCLVLDVGGNEEIVKKLAIVALWCIQWSPEDRPSMTRIVQMLGENLQNLQVPPNPVMPSSYCVDTSGHGI